MTPETLVELSALALAAWAAIKSVPRPPALDWERLFKVALATVIRGDAERAGGDLAAWEAAVLGRVLYHPAAGDQPERKLIDPLTAPVPVPARPGERALVEALAKLPDASARFKWMYTEDHGAAEALFLHPEALGEAYDPALALSPGLDWEALAAWTEPVQQALARRLDFLVLVDLGGQLGGALSAAAPGLRGVTEDPTLEGEALARALLGRAQAPSDRLAVFAEGGRALALIKAMRQSPALVDRVAAVIAVAGELATGPDEAAWLAQNFTHEGLEPELHRAIPYISLLRAAADGEGALPWASQRFPAPPPITSGRDAIEVIDLGPLVLDALRPGDIARALGLLLSRRLNG